MPFLSHFVALRILKSNIGVIDKVAINRFLGIWESEEGMKRGGEFVERPLKTQTRLSPAKNHLEF